MTASTTSLTVPPSAARICLTSASDDRAQLQRRCGPIGPLRSAVGLRSIDTITDALRRTLPRLMPPGSGERASAGSPVSVDWGEQVADRGVRQQLQVARLPPRRPLLDLGLLHLRGVVQEHRQQVGARHPVDHAVVDLRDQRPAPALEPLHDPHLPERLAAVEVLGEDPPGQVAQLLVAAGRRHRRVPDVVQDLEVGVVHPDRPPQLQRHHPHLLPVARDQRQLAGHHPDDVAVGGRRALEDRDVADVHRVVVVLDREKGRVERVHPVHRETSVGTLSLRRRRHRRDLIPRRPPSTGDRQMGSKDRPKETKKKKLKKAPVPKTSRNQRIAGARHTAAGTRPGLGSSREGFSSGRGCSRPWQPPKSTTAAPHPRPRSRRSRRP